MVDNELDRQLTKMDLECRRHPSRPSRRHGHLLPSEAALSYWKGIGLRTLRIGTQIGPFDPFWVQVREAVYQNAQRFGVEMVSIELPEYPAILAREEQASLLEEFLTQELDVLIALNLSDDKTEPLAGWRQVRPPSRATASGTPGARP